nr:argininosuccinate synthase domain-containing protein [Aeromonas salmonicida]
MSGINKIVLAYSGGLDTSAIIPWLKERRCCPNQPANHDFPSPK